VQLRLVAPVPGFYFSARVNADWLSDDIYPCNKFACRAGGVPPPPLLVAVPEIGWRRDPADESYYFLVLNPEDRHRDAVSLDLGGVHPSGTVEVIDEGRAAAVADGNAIVDDFDPYELHIYRVPAGEDDD
jgi:hypothetical protein